MSARITVFAGFFMLALAVIGVGCLDENQIPMAWRVIEPGLDIAHFDSSTKSPSASGDLTVLRVDPQRWALRVLTTETAGDDRARTLARWCKDFHLVAAINAGMYQQDGQTHVGYCKVEGKVINAAVNKYQSAVALDPVSKTQPRFRIFDLDETSLTEVTAAYGTVVQNLRLIKRPFDPRWPRGDASWSEAALGVDDKGRALLIYGTRPMSMHDFNQLLLDLPLQLVCAQHLEGNFPAQLWIQPSAVGKIPGSQLSEGKVLPLILGVMARNGPANAPGPRDQ